MHATGRASYTPTLSTSTAAMATTRAGYWYWRIVEGRVEAVHSIRGTVVRCSDKTAGAVAQLANALNRAYGYDDAPRFDEQTGDARGGVL